MIKIFKESDLFKFSLTDNAGAMLLISSGYTQKTNCQKGISSLKRNSKNEDRFEILERWVPGKWFFTIKAGNGKKVAESLDFQTREAAQDVIKRVMKLAPTLEIIDLTKNKVMKNIF